MRIQSSLLGWLAKAAPGANRPAEDDALLMLSPNLFNAGRFPYPHTRTIANGSSLLATEKVVGSFSGGRFDVFGSALGLDWIQFSEGVWDIDLVHQTVPRGAVNDLTADASVFLQLADSGVTRASLISRMVPLNTQAQMLNRRFVLTVTKEIQVSIRMQHAIGLGTSTVESHVSIIATKVL